MTAGALLLTLSGLLLSAGLVGVVGAVRGVSFLPERSPSVRSSSRRRATPLLLGGLAAGVLTLLVTGWPAAALGAEGLDAVMVHSARAGTVLARQAGARLKDLIVLALSPACAAPFAVPIRRRMSASSPLISVPLR